ncbi:transcriptional repressor [Streptomyces sp. NPDC047070]|uniref:Fur family transcriptional regulator n=1 Tax=Streptomyces sp. NPDC047070 TaxID=3154923 RepID=UPI00345205DD
MHLTTVYRALIALTEAGVVHAVHGPGPTRYGLTGEPHHHTFCQQCGQVTAIANEHLTETVRRLAELTGLQPDSAGSLLAYGRCEGCSA